MAVSKLLEIQLIFQLVMSCDDQRCHINCLWPFQRQRTGFPVWYCRSHYEPCDPLWRSSSTTGFEYKVHMKSCVATCGLSFLFIYLQLPWRMIPAGLLNLASLSSVSNVAACCFLLWMPNVTCSKKILVQRRFCNSPLD
jgi:hypothetical protein